MNIPDNLLQAELCLKEEKYIVVLVDGRVCVSNCKIVD